MKDWRRFGKRKGKRTDSGKGEERRVREQKEDKLLGMEQRGDIWDAGREGMGIRANKEKKKSGEGLVYLQHLTLLHTHTHTHTGTLTHTRDMMLVLASALLLAL